MESVFSEPSSDWFYCSCESWTGHIMNIIPSFCTAALSSTIFMPCILAKMYDIICRQLLCAVVFFIPKLPQFWHHKAPHSTHKHTNTLLFHTSKCWSLLGLSTIANMALPFFSPLCRQPSGPVLTALLLMFIFPQHLITLCFIRHSSFIVSVPMATGSCVFFLQWDSRILAFSFDVCVPLWVSSWGH